MSGLVVWAHGAEAPPWGTKSLRLAAVAAEAGFEFQAPDFSDLSDPDARAERLATLVRELRPDVLAGSSMGAYACLRAASRGGNVSGLFLTAPALFIPGYAVTEFNTPDVPTEVIHGWRDDIVPVQNAIRFAHRHRATLHLLDADHRLAGRTEDVADFFRLFLNSLRRGAPCRG